MKKYTKVLSVLVCMLSIIILLQTISYATDLDTIINSMSKVGNVATSNGKISKILNATIRMIQVAGTGISVIVVTALGIKYMFASSNDKADIKKMGMPIVIGCALLFAATNLVAIIASFGMSLNN